MCMHMNAVQATEFERDVALAQFLIDHYTTLFQSYLTNNGKNSQHARSLQHLKVK
jgi:hypothetical protein